MRIFGNDQFTDDRAVERFMERWVTTEDKEFCQQGIEQYVQQSDICLSSVGDSWKTVGKAVRIWTVIATRENK